MSKLKSKTATLLATAAVSGIAITGLSGFAAAPAQAETTAPASPESSTGSPITGSVTLDPVAIVGAISAAVNDQGDREGAVKAALDVGYYNAGNPERLTVAVVNKNQDITVEGAIAMLVRMFPTGTGETDYAEGLLILREDMRDPVLRARGTEWGEVLALALGRRLTQDWVNQIRLGRLMASQWQGAQIWWAFSRRGDPAVVIAAELRDWCEVVLRPRGRK